MQPLVDAVLGVMGSVHQDLLAKREARSGGSGVAVPTHAVEFPFAGSLQPTMPFSRLRQLCIDKLLGGLGIPGGVQQLTALRRQCAVWGGVPKAASPALCGPLTLDVHDLPVSSEDNSPREDSPPRETDPRRSQQKRKLTSPNPYRKRLCDDDVGVKQVSQPVSLSGGGRMGGMGGGGGGGGRGGKIL
jgi:hypothetical protein